MPDAYRLDELRFPQEYTETSAAGATTIDATGFTVPANTIRTLLLASYQPNVGEARTVVAKIITSSGQTFSFRGPYAYDSNGGAPTAFLEQGNQLQMLPGDRIRVDRDAATAGSTMTVRFRFVDVYMPFQQHYDPQNVRRKATPWIPSRGAGGAGVSGGTPPGGGGPPSSPGSGSTPPAVV